MSKLVSCDTSSVLNFFKVNRIDLLEKSSHSFFITDHVQEEITAHYPEQQSLLEIALKKKTFERVNVETSEEYAIFAELSRSGQLGSGECAAIAVASYRKYFLLIDDAQAIKKAASFIDPHLILRTQDLVVHMIQEGLLAHDEADLMITVWAEKHRFKLKIKSFSELLPLALSETSLV